MKIKTDFFVRIESITIEHLTYHERILELIGRLIESLSKESDCLDEPPDKGDIF